MHTIYIIEDDQSIRGNLEIFLEEEGFKIYGFESSESALQKIDTFPPHLSIVEIRMPGMGGEEYILKASQKYPNMKFIIYTGLVGYEPSNALKNLGVSKGQILFKPIPNFEKILNLINASLKS